MARLPGVDKLRLCISGTQCSLFPVGTKKKGGGGSELEQVMERDRDGGGGLRNEWGVLEDKG